MSIKTPHQICIDTLIELGFIGEETHFEKGDCHIWIMQNTIKLWYNIPGVDKEYIGPPIPSAEELKKFVKENSF